MAKYYKRIDIFLSSTFQDMSGERDMAVNCINSELKQWGRFFGFDINVIDLRWGISISESEQGRTIPLCLRAVERSVPFVISFVGDYSGWIPQKEELPDSIKYLLDNPEEVQKYNYPTGIKDTLKILADGVGKRSITEIEIQKALAGKYSGNILFLIRKEERNRIAGKCTGLKEIARKHGGYEYTARWNEEKKCYENFCVGDKKLRDFIKDYIRTQCIRLYPEYFNHARRPEDYYIYKLKLPTSYDVLNLEKSIL